MTSVRLIFALILIAIYINQCKGGRLQDHFYLDYLICKFNPMFAVNATCKLTFITRLQKSMSISAVAIKPIDRAVGRVQLYYKFRAGYKPLLIDITCNLCDYIQGRVESKVMDFIIPKAQVHAARKFTCPYEGLFAIENMPINMGTLDNIFLPAGSYMMNLTIRVRKEFLWNGKFYFILPEGKTVEDDRMG